MTDAAGRMASALGDRYTIERELGAGGMATVYLAHDLRHDRPVALKVLRAELAAVIGAERFLAEIKTTANLQHPHILPLFDSGEAEGFLYYVMPYVEGESLRDRLSREKQLPVDEAIRVATEVASALDYAHRHGVVHRDIKPENILLHEGQALVADFGIALAVTRVGGTRLTETGMSLGTPQYMAPEQAMGEREITPKADVYALGCVLYEMLLGEPPFTGPTAQAVIAKAVTERPARLVPRRERVPLQVEEAVLRALERLPADRFASAAQFAQAVRAAPATPGWGGALRAAGGALAWLGDWRSWIAMGVAAAALAAVLLRGGGATPPPAPVARFNVALPGEPTAGAAAFSTVPAISSDGTVIVYAAVASDSGGGTRRQIFARALDQLEPVPIPGTEGGRAPFFSPDGRWIGFWVGARLVKTPVTGGAPITLADSTNPSFFGTASWGRDGKIVFPIGTDALAEVADAGGTPTILYRDSTQVVGDPTTLPDGRGVLFLRCRWDACGQRQEIAILDPAAHAVRTLSRPAVFRLAQYLAAGYLVYVRGDLYVHADADLVVAPFDLRRGITGEAVPVAEGVQSFALSRNGTLVTLSAAASGDSLVEVDADGRERRLAEYPRAYLFPTVSPDGRRVAVEIHDAAGGQIWVYDTTSRTLTRLTTLGHNSQPAWSPDGKWIAYSSARETASGVYAVSADGGGSERRLGRANAAIGYSSVSWSPDGRRLAYDVESVENGASYTVATATDSVSRRIAAVPSGATRPVFSPDGRWLAYVWSGSGREEVFVSPYPGPGGRWAVSVNGGAWPVWAPSGHTLFYRGGDGWLYAAALRLGREVVVADRSRLFDASPYADLGFGVFPDGRHFVFVRENRTPPEVHVTLNWFTELARRLRVGRGSRSP
jgi:eukaryotic-like serine/threonine-protein kinase